MIKKKLSAVTNETFVLIALKIIRNWKIAVC